MITRDLPISQLFGKSIVICGRADDAQAWRDLLGPDRCLALALDDVPPAIRRRTLRGASEQLTWQHQAIAGLDGSGWLAEPANTFDPHHAATLVLPDPLNPPHAGARKRIGIRQPAWRLFEDKTLVDALWQVIGVPRAQSIVTDGTADLAALGSIVDCGTGVVCSCQPIGTVPASGGDGIWWWRDSQPPATIPKSEASTWRIRLMPLLEGIPVRLHGMNLTSRVIAFPPMELVTLPRVEHGTFLCAGAVPILGPVADLVLQTERLGAGLREHLGYRGGFSVDGILTDNGFLPTDFNARLTSAMEAAPSQLRVQLHMINLLARDGVEPDSAVVEQLAEKTFTTDGTCTLFGATTHAGTTVPQEVAVCWNGDRLVLASTAISDGALALTAYPRGWLLTAKLVTDQLPSGCRVGPLAPEVFRISDEVFGTEFGKLAPPFAPQSVAEPAPTAPTSH